ncbi:MAG: amidohydrolase [Synergistes sp.]|nr:amidohydrolase [Synergistes sp.]
MPDVTRADSIALINGIIYPMAYPGRAQALFARAGIIESVGSNADILKMCDTKTIVLDMKGAFILPGFTDTHISVLLSGIAAQMLDLSRVSSINRIISAARKFFAVHSPADNGWLYAVGWNEEKLEEKRYPNRYDLDKISTDMPMLFERSCGTVVSLNSKAIEVLGITRDLEIHGGTMFLDDNGEPNGVMGGAAVHWTKMRIPKVNEDTLERCFSLAAQQLIKRGVTSVQTDDVAVVGDPDRVFSLYENLDAKDKVPLRLTEQWPFQNIKELSEFVRHGSHLRHSRYFRSGPLKIQVDGSLGAYTAALREDYNDDPGNRGVYLHTQEELNEMTALAQEAGMLVAFCAVGDGAIERSLNAVEYAANKTHSHVRHRIIHCQVMPDDLCARMVTLGVMADIQPVFISSDWSIIMSRLGAERARSSYAWKTMIASGIPVGAGSNAPIAPSDPFTGIVTSMTRRDKRGKPEHGWIPSQRLDRVEAFAVYTSGGSNVCGELAWRGTLEKGKAADFIACMQDPFTVHEEEIDKIEIGLTVVDGKIRYIK